VVDAAGKTTGYKLAPLPKPSIDTGMGLERVAAVLQRKVSNFETDLFVPLINAAAKLVGFEDKPISWFSAGSNYVPTPEEQEKFHERKRIDSASLRIIADHARAATFLISDGVLPSNEGRGYVLRKILRRGIRHGRLLGQDDPFMCQMVYSVRDQMVAAYPELADSAGRVSQVIEAEERQFARVLSEGSRRFDQAVAALIRSDVEKHLSPNFPFDGSPMSDDLAVFDSPSPGASLAKVIRAVKFCRGISPQSPMPVNFPGDQAFHLYETFGLPLDFMTDAARDYGIGFDLSGFEAAKESEQARARASWKGGSQKTASPAFRDLPKTVFEGYRQLTSTNCEVLAIVKGGVGVPAAKAGDEVEVVLDHTSFYGDSGGQVGDLGWFTSTDGNATIAEIVGCVLPVQGVRAHKAILKQPLAVGDRVNTVVDGTRRDAIRRNHTGTHLLHAALRQVLGTHVKQAGSAVHPDRLRFDFSHFSQVADEELQEIEDIVNREVLANAKVETLEDVPIDVAVNEYHAMALFGEKYGDKVRVVKLSDGFSTELCGGTHTAATGEIGLMKLTSEESVSSGVRRIEAISGMGSLDTFRKDFELAKVAGQFVPAGGSLSEQLVAKFAAQDDELKKLRREIEEMRMKSAAGGLDEAVSRAVEVKGVKVLTHRADELERGQLRTLVDNLKQKLGEGVVVLGSAQPEGKVAIIAGVTQGLTKRIQAGKLVGAVAKIVGGSGGGKPEIAEAGGKDQSQIDAALKAAAGIVGEMLA
jgi:alanyl-tRNA synthetase